MACCKFQIAKRGLASDRYVLGFLNRLNQQYIYIMTFKHLAH